MIVYKVWYTVDVGKEYYKEGWYLFGIIPLYIRRITPIWKRR